MEQRGISWGMVFTICISFKGDRMAKNIDVFEFQVSKKKYKFKSLKDVEKLVMKADATVLEELLKNDDFFDWILGIDDELSDAIKDWYKDLEEILKIDEKTRKNIQKTVPNILTFDVKGKDEKVPEFEEKKKKAKKVSARKQKKLDKKKEKELKKEEARMQKIQKKASFLDEEMEDVAFDPDDQVSQSKGKDELLSIVIDESGEESIEDITEDEEEIKQRVGKEVSKIKKEIDDDYDDEEEEEED